MRMTTIKREVEEAYVRLRGHATFGEMTDSQMKLFITDLDLLKDQFNHLYEESEKWKASAIETIENFKSRIFWLDAALVNEAACTKQLKEKVEKLSSINCNSPTFEALKNLCDEQSKKIDAHEQTERVNFGIINSLCTEKDEANKKIDDLSEKLQCKDEIILSLEEKIALCQSNHFIRKPFSIDTSINYPHKSYKLDFSEGLKKELVRLNEVIKSQDIDLKNRQEELDSYQTHLSACQNALSYALHRSSYPIDSRGPGIYVIRRIASDIQFFPIPKKYAFCMDMHGNIVSEGITFNV